MLWVDAVGGFWVCTGDELVLGQPVPSGEVDIPILGDISGRHARIRRDEEGYLIEAIREVRLDGRKVDKMDILRNGSEITLGEAVRLVFRRPHALSATARLDFLSHHRTQPSADAVLLMADTLILGPNPRSHVVCPEWPQEVVLARQSRNQIVGRTSGPSRRTRGPSYKHARTACRCSRTKTLFRQEQQLLCRTAGPLEIDGTSCQDQGCVTPNSRIEGKGFSLSLEEI